MNEISAAWLPELISHLKGPAPFIQILLGPRQVGKTTSLVRLLESWPKVAGVMSSADERQVLGKLWIEQQWEKARSLRATHPRVLLILDEIQKIQNWSETVKRLWDEDQIQKRRLHVVLSGSSALSIQSGLTESLLGRFEIIQATHLDWKGFHQLTNSSIEDFLFFGGYPGALQFIGDEKRWKNYILDSIIESILSKDILLLTRVEKPGLLRRLFQLGCEYSGQVLSYQKALGQLQDAGNTTTLAHYLKLLELAFVLSGLQKFEFTHSRKRASSPKFQVHNTALMGALGGYDKAEAQARPEIWGRYVESAVGAYLINQSRIENFELFYWRNGNEEVDFVLKQGHKIAAIEVKSGQRGKLSGLKAFKAKMPRAKTHCLSTTDLENFLSTPATDLF